MSNVESMRTLGNQVYFKIWNDNKLDYEHIWVLIGSGESFDIK